MSFRFRGHVAPGLGASLLIDRSSWALKERRDGCRCRHPKEKDSRRHPLLTQLLLSLFRSTESTFLSPAFHSSLGALNLSGCFLVSFARCLFANCPFSLLCTLALAGPFPLAWVPSYVNGSRPVCTLQGLPPERGSRPASKWPGCLLACTSWLR